MATVTWQFDLVVLNHVLLDNRISRRLQFALIDCGCVEVSLWDEAAVSGQVIGCLCGTDVELVFINCKLCRLRVQLVAWVVTVSAQRARVLGLEETTLGRVSLARQ